MVLNNNESDGAAVDVVAVVAVVAAAVAVATVAAFFLHLDILAGFALSKEIPAEVIKNSKEIRFMYIYLDRKNKLFASINVHINYF